MTTAHTEGAGHFLAELRKRATGGQTVTRCRHPDIDNESRDPTTFLRQCVIDQGMPEECEVSRHDARPRVVDKSACQFWLPLPETEPAGATPEEVLRLLDMIPPLKPWMNDERPEVSENELSSPHQVARALPSDDRPDLCPARGD